MCAGGVVAVKGESEFGVVQNVPGENKEGAGVASESSPKTDATGLISDASMGSAGLASMLVKDEPGDPQVGELRALDNGNLQVVKASGNPSVATSSPDEEPVKHAAENGKAEAGTVRSEAITSTTSAAALVENEDVNKVAESIVADVHEESVEAAKQGSLQSAEADNGVANKFTEDSPSHAACLEKESSVVDDIPAVAELQELSGEVAKGHMAAAGGEKSIGTEEATIEESSVPAGDAQSVEGSNEADRQILQGDEISEVVPRGPTDADLGTPVLDDKVESSLEDSTIVSDTTEEVPKAAEVGAAEKSWQSEALALELVGSATDEV